jgi:hypothetical protein
MSVAGAADVTCAGGRAKVRVSLVPARSGVSVHVRALSCFVRPAGGRASGATQLEAPGRIELVAPNQQVIAAASVLFGSPAAGHSLFQVGDMTFAIGVDECPRAVAFDFGPGAECVFVYVPPAGPIRPGQGSTSGAGPGMPGSREERTSQRWRRRGPQS